MATTKVTTDVIDMSGNTGGLVWAKGATGDQPLPVDSVAGDMRENTTTGKTEVFNGTEWKNLKEAASTITVDYLVVAGGGAGGRGSGVGGGGGGAGGLRTSYPLPTGNSGGGASAETALALLVATDYIVTVGAGASGPTSGNTSGPSGFDSVFSTITSLGGGGGTTEIPPGISGGSGGGSYTGGVGAGTANQGFDGGISESGSSSGGGGGAASVGANSNYFTPTVGNGGLGLQNSITGSVVTYAGGGGGGRYLSEQGGPGAGGSGIGGNGGNGSAGGDGSPNTGSGGGGAANSQNGGSGGSGIVVLRYPDTYSITVGAGLITGVLNQAVGVGEKYTTFTEGTGTITFS